MTPSHNVYVPVVSASFALTLMSSHLVFCDEEHNKYVMPAKPLIEQQKAEFVESIVKRTEFSRRIPPVMIEKATGRDDKQTPIYIWHIEPRSLIDVSSVLFLF